MYHIIPTALDEKDAALLAQRQYDYMHDSNDRPRIGDWVDYADGVQARVAHVYDWEPCGVQTAAPRGHGSIYLGEGYTSFSGGLDPAIPLSSLTLTEHARPGRVWFFHHNHWCVNNGIETTMPFRVYRCAQSSTERNSR
jgi:hypothetical protein